MTRVSSAQRHQASADLRRAHRHRLTLAVDVEAEGSRRFRGIIHELSRSGFLLQCDAGVGVGDRIALPAFDQARCDARVVWTCAPYLACKFDRMLTGGQVSAALLKSAPEPIAAVLPWEVTPPRGLAARHTVGCRRSAEMKRIAFLAVLAWTALAAGVTLLLN